MIPRNPQVMPPADQSLLQYKSVTLEPNSRHEVYVSYINDGPCHFSVQLKKSEGILAQLMREINSIPLKPLEELPIPGTVCLAKCMEDSHICRAVITSEVDNQYKLFYVDFGNTEVVPPDNLYQMPFKYIIPKIMAIRLSLNGIDKSTVTLEMQCAFKQFVDNRLLMMEVYLSPKKMCLPQCRMWDPETNIDVMDILNKAAQLAFPNVIALHRGFTRPVKVTFVYSCNKFYIHLKSNEDELNNLMAELQIYCNSNDATHLQNPKVGLPCCAEFAFDGQWYRSSILSLNETSATVKYIDYGNDEEVPIQSLKNIEGRFLTCMRPQAIECCLNGYQKMAEDIERDNKLEELILDKEFTMKVIDIIDNKSLVDLIDINGSTVTSLLMEAMVTQPKVISNNHFESTTQNYGTETSDRNNGKSQDEGFWSPRDKSQGRKDDEDWRQNSRKSNGTIPIDNSEPWRQTNNKEWHDNTSNESFSKDKRENGNRRKSPNTQGSDNNNRSSSNQARNHNRKSSDFQENGHNENYQPGGNDKQENRFRNKNRLDNEDHVNKENTFKNKSQNFNDSWNTDKLNRSLEENEEFQGVKKKPRNFSGTKSHTGGGRADSDEWGNKKNIYNSNDNEKIAYREKQFDGSYNKGREGKFNDGNDYKKKSFRKDNDFNSNDNNRMDGRKFNSRNESKWSDKNNSNSHTNYSTFDEPKKVMDPAPEDATFQTSDVIGTQKVALSWFHNPCSFFCQLMDSQQSFTKMMEELQETYKDIPSSHCGKGAPAVALFPEDNVFYRSKILKSMGNQYKVYYVDFGNISVVDKVWPIERKYMDLPMQAIPCGLGGIQAVEGEWPDPTSFTNYMQKDCLDCEFLGFEVDRYMVNLFSNGQEIKQQLIQDNLAKYIEPLVPMIEFDMNFIVGLTFRAMIDYVNDLADFGISLQNGLQFMCSSHNLTSATEKYEDELKQWQGQVLIVYCDDVSENRLHVTLYNHEGIKLNILNPDEGAFETVEPICPYLLIQSKVQGFVCSVNDTSIVIQPTDCINRLEELLNEIYEHYNGKEEECKPEEGYIYAVCSGDCNWYRGRVVSVDSEKVTVMYIDYGNTEDVTPSSLRMLDSKFYWWDKMSIEVHLNIPTADLFEKNVTVQVFYGDQGLEGEILEVEEGTIPEGAQLEINNIEQKFNTSCHVTEDLSIQPEPIEDSLNTSVNIPNESSNTSTMNIDTKSSCDQNVDAACESSGVILSHIDSPSEFYVQLIDSQNAISEIQSRLQEHIEEMPILENATVGGLCAAPYSVDQMWYRSQILDADEDITTVRFIDYGNTDVIDNKTTQIKTLPAEFLSLEEYATRCRLKIKPLEQEWSKTATDRFEELAYVEDIRVQFLNQDEKANHVELFSNGENVKDILIAENLALIDEDLVLDSRLKGYISNMNSPSEFWLQLDGWCAELEWIAEQLSNAASFLDLEDYTPGSLCAAMFPDDGMWYRARILSNTVAGLEVLFLDYGNACVCANLKQLPEHLVMVPPLALKCSLYKPAGLLSWSTEAAQKFSEISADGQTEFTVKKLTTGETSVVELYANDEPISSKLLPITETVNIIDIQSLDSFSLSKEGIVSNERYGLEKIPGTEYNQEVVGKFLDLNNEGQACFEVEYLSDNIVRLYINGNDIRKEIFSLFEIENVECEKSTGSLQVDSITAENTLNLCEKPIHTPQAHLQENSENVNEKSLSPKLPSEPTPEDIDGNSLTFHERENNRQTSQEVSETLCRDLLVQTINLAIEELPVDICNIPQEQSIENGVENNFEGAIEVCSNLLEETVRHVTEEKIFNNENYESVYQDHDKIEECSEFCEKVSNQNCNEQIENSLNNENKEETELSSDLEVFVEKEIEQENVKAEITQNFQILHTDENPEPCSYSTQVCESPFIKESDESELNMDKTFNTEDLEVKKEKITETDQVSEIAETNDENKQDVDTHNEINAGDITIITDGTKDSCQLNMDRTSNNEDLEVKKEKLTETDQIPEIAEVISEINRNNSIMEVCTNENFENTCKETINPIEKSKNETKEENEQDVDTHKKINVGDKRVITDGTQDSDTNNQASEEKTSEEEEKQKKVEINNIVDLNSEGKTNSKLEYTETIMTTFSPPTVSENKILPKLSPSKVSPKLSMEMGSEESAEQ